MSETLGTMFWDRVEKSGGGPAQMFKRHSAWTTLTWREVGEIVREVARGLLALGRQPGDAVALLSTSRAEWVQADFAIFSAGCITVPVYPTYPPDLIAYVVNDSGARTIIVEDPGQLAKVLEVRDKTPGLEHIIVMTGYEATQPPKMVLTWEMLRRVGRDNAARHAGTLAARLAGTKPDDLASIVYTSGTTGPPKGVMQTHGNHIAAQKNSESAAPCEEGWVHLLFLPLAHSFARLESFLGGHPHPGGLRADRDLSGRHLQPADALQVRLGRPAARQRGDQDRRRRRDPHPRRQRRQGLSQAAGGDGRGLRALGLVPQRRHRATRRGRLPLHHRQKEGPHRHRRRHEHRAAEHRESPEGRSVHQPGHGVRRPQAVPGGADHGQSGRAVEVRARPRHPHHGPGCGRQASQGRRAHRAHRRGEELAAAVVREDQEVHGPARGLQPGGRRADADAEGEAQDRVQQVHEHDRGAVPLTVLAGKVAVVTGASRGLGRAMARALAEAGARVALAGRSKPDLEMTARQIEGGGGQALVVPTDVTRYAEVEALMECAVRELGGLDVVVNNAGIAGVTPFAEATPEDWRAILDVNLTGVFNGCRAAAPHLIARGAGKVVNLASVRGAVGLPGYTLYAATKGGVMALTRTLGVEWARHNVQVNTIAPGRFVTDINERAFGDPRINERLTRDIPMRRTGRLEEIGPLVVFLASSGSDFMTGQTVFLDGGHSAA